MQLVLNVMLCYSLLGSWFDIKHEDFLVLQLRII